MSFLIFEDIIPYREEDAETLWAYLLHERSIPRTAEALIIHRTTLTYRLGKLEELWNLNLDDSDTRLYLLLSFRMLEAGREP